MTIDKLLTPNVTTKYYNILFRVILKQKKIIIIMPKKKMTTCHLSLGTKHIPVKYSSVTAKDACCACWAALRISILLLICGVHSFYGNSTTTSLTQILFLFLSSISKFYRVILVKNNQNDDPPLLLLLVTTTMIPLWTRMIILATAVIVSLIQNTIEVLWKQKRDAETTSMTTITTGRLN